MFELGFSMAERRVIPKQVKDDIRRVVAGLPDATENVGMVVTIVGPGFSGNLVAKDGRWKTKDKSFRVRVETDSEEE